MQTERGADIPLPPAILVVQVDISMEVFFETSKSTII